MENGDRHEELEATIRRVKGLVIDAKLAPNETMQERYLKEVCLELRKFLAEG